MVFPHPSFYLYSGVSLPGNRRPSRLKARKTREIKVAVPSRRQVHSEMLSDSAGSKSISYCSTTDQVCIIQKFR